MSSLLSFVSWPRPARRKQSDEASVFDRGTPTTPSWTPPRHASSPASRPASSRRALLAYAVAQAVCVALALALWSSIVGGSREPWATPRGPRPDHHFQHHPPPPPPSFHPELDDLDDFDELEAEVRAADPWGGYAEVCQGKIAREICDTYGAHNVKLSRSYEGTSARLRETFRRIQSTQAPLRIAAIGGSITTGHGVNGDEVWAQHVHDVMKLVHPHEESSFRNGALGATGSDFFAPCWETRIHKNEVDLVVIELGVNDILETASGLTFEDLLRGVLSLPQRPAVIVVRALGLEGDTIATGGDIHLPIAVYYDAPTISMRPVLLPVLAANASRAPEYFVVWDWDPPSLDLRHINKRGHRALGDLVVSYMLEQWRMAERQLETLREFEIQSWMDPPGPAPSYSNAWPGLHTMGQVPKLKLFSHFDPDRTVPPFEAQCMSMNQDEYSLNPLEPSISSNQGWFKWTPPQTPDKTYMFTNVTGSTISFDVNVTGDKVELHYLKSGEPQYHLGDVRCWIDEDEAGGATLAGYWPRWENIGKFGVVAEGITPGRHRLSCRLLETSDNPHGGTEFRIISVVVL